MENKIKEKCKEWQEHSITWTENMSGCGDEL